MNKTASVRAGSIDEVIHELDSIIEWSRQQESRIGYFATLYRKMTIAVKNNMANNSFDDPGRMETLDIIFANRYLDAFNAYINNLPCPNAWCKAFDTAKQNDLIVLQHIILGINTHINLDLALAAAEVCSDDKIYNLEHDFNN